MSDSTTALTTTNLELYAYRVRFEDGTQIPSSFFSELVAADTIETWDNLSPTPGSTVKNLIEATLRNREGASVLTGLFVEATNITRQIEIMDMTGKIESAEIKFEDDETNVEDSEDEGGSPKLIFKFQRWRMGVLPEEGIVVIERKGTGYDKKLSDFFTSWAHKWSQKGTRGFKSIKVEPYLTGDTPSSFFSGGAVGMVEFALSSEVLSENESFFDSDIRDMFKKDKNLVVSIAVKAKRGQAFLPEMTSDFVNFIDKYESSIQKFSGKKVVNNRKSKPIDLINNLHHKVVSLTGLDDTTVLAGVEEYLLELFEDQE
ncbi:hypothetical protein [Halobacteriovorax sp. RT-2-4]|uniref:hypothetical protein n=1 Tax=unclassified Halobacteriovorax TaxID=2639665 RepID=UPI00399B17D0